MKKIVTTSMALSLIFMAHTCKRGREGAGATGELRNMAPLIEIAPLEQERGQWKIAASDAVTATVTAPGAERIQILGRPEGLVEGRSARVRAIGTVGIRGRAHDCRDHRQAGLFAGRRGERNQSSRGRARDDPTRRGRVDFRRDRRFADAAQKAFGKDDVLEMLKYKAKQNDDFAKRILHMMEESVGKMVIESAPAKQFMRFVWMTRHPYGSLGWCMQKNEMKRARYGDPYFDMPLDSLDVSVFQNKKRLNLTKAVKWTSKSSSVFNYGIDNLIEDMGLGNSFYAQYKIFRSLNQSHAFDRGDNQAVQWMDSSRREVIMHTAHQVSHYYPKDLRPLYGDVDSTSSFYTQAADIAAGFARHLYQQQGIVSLTDKFEYVIFNGQRISRADAEEKMREWEREGYIQNTKKVIYQS